MKHDLHVRKHNFFSICTWPFRMVVKCLAPRVWPWVVQGRFCPLRFIVSVSVGLCFNLSRHNWKTNICHVYKI